LGNQLTFNKTIGGNTMSVTNFDDANIAVFKLTSAGSAYNLTVPFEADTIEWFNYTKYATDSNNLQGIWFNGFPAGDGLIIARGTTTLTSTLEATNAVTELADGSGFASTQITPTAITAATAVVTATNTLINGQFVRATNFRATPVADATGMYGLNNQVFQVGNVSGSAFTLYLPYTTTIPVLTSETAFANTGVAKFNLIGESLNTQNPAPVYRYTLGSAIMGAASDVIYIRAMKANQYTNLGQV
jgi:hypothetical protein